MPITGTTPIPVLAGAMVQTPQQLLPIPPDPGPLDLDDIQGDILIGMQKKAQRLVFFKIRDGAVAPFRTELREVIHPLITSSRTVHEREEDLQRAKIAKVQALDPSTDWQALKPMSAVNVAFTARGLRKLLSPADAAGLDAFAPSFVKSAVELAATCGDPLDPGRTRPLDWETGFDHDAVDGVLNIAGSSRDEVDSTWQRLQGRLHHVIDQIWENGAVGAVRPGRHAGHEHFGWKDGVSQPAVAGLAEPFPGQAVVDPGLFVVGAPGGAAPPDVLSWMANGSFMVFRKLEQDVPKFEAFVVGEAARLQMDPDLLAARLFGRWKSGAPLALAPLQDDAVLGGRADRNNDFDFRSDPDQRRCPYGAHIRKTNPRSDMDAFGGVGGVRIMRQGIPYGREVSEDRDGGRGLLFVCYQADIAEQFEVQQRAWADAEDFPRGKTRMTPSGRIDVKPGLDPIIGQAPTPPAAAQAAPAAAPAPAGPQWEQPATQAAVPAAPPAPPAAMDEPFPNYPTGNERTTLTPADATRRYVIPRAGLYLFAPSLSALATVLAS